MAAISAGKLRSQVTLQSPVHTADDSGDTATAWKDEAIVWAAIEPLNSREYWQAQQTQSSVSHKITMRYRSGVKADWRITFGCRVFELQGSPIDIDERHQWLTMLATERT